MRMTKEVPQHVAQGREKSWNHVAQFANDVCVQNINLSLLHFCMWFCMHNTCVSAYPRSSVHKMCRCAIWVGACVQRCAKEDSTQFLTRKLFADLCQNGEEFCNSWGASSNLYAMQFRKVICRMLELKPANQVQQTMLHTHSHFKQLLNFNNKYLRYRNFDVWLIMLT